MGNIGLLLGAGASYEVGLPLVWDLTEELRNYLTDEKLRSLNASWRSQDEGYSENLIEELISVLHNPWMHYESILGYLEVGYGRAGPYRREYHGLYARLVEIVWLCLYCRHVKNERYILGRLGYLDGIVDMAQANMPLWIFSLNHDLVVELLAEKHKVPLSCGFMDKDTLPRRDATGNYVGDLHVETISSENLDSGKLGFYTHGTHGINLLKIHGALDIFTRHDGKDVLRILPGSPGVDSVISALQSIQQELKYIDPNTGAPVNAHVVNEIAYSDKAGKLQFLRRSILAGTFKFNQRRDQVLPKVYLKLFKSYIQNVATLHVIGYGFGDAHVNLVIREWLEISPERKLFIVGPKPSMPAEVLHLAPQVEIVESSATGYLSSASK
jgi:hypothetical protein